LKKEILLSLFAISFLFSLNITVWAQSISIDSLVEALGKLPYEQQAKQLCQINYDVLVANTGKLIPVFEQLLNSDKIEKKSLYQAEILEQISLAYYIVGKYEKSFDAGFSALNIYDSLKVFNSVGKMYGELGYRSKRIDLNKAFNLMQKGIAILSRINDREQLAKIYDNYGVLHEMNNRFDSSIFYYQKTLKIKKTLNDRHGLAYTYGNIFISYMQSNNPEKALHYLDSSVFIRRQINDQTGLAVSYSYYGEYYQLSNELDKAINYFNLALRISDSLNYRDLEGQMHQKLSDCFERKNDMQKALFHLKIFKQIQDSLLNASTNKTIADLQIKYETAEKEKEIERQEIKLKVRTIQLLFLLASTILIILGFLLLYTRYKHKQKIKLHQKLAAERHQRLLAVIAAEEKERTRLARELHDGLGQLLSTTRINLAGLEETIPVDDKFLLNNALNIIDQSVTEVRQISHNLMPVSLEKYGLKAAIEEIARQINQSAKVKVNLDFINIENRFAQNIEHSIYRIVQEIVNNIIKHAGATIIQITLKNQDESEIQLNIENDGKTFDPSKLDEATGIGWKNIFNRLSIINGHIRILPGEKSGTQIQIEIPTKACVNR
jgi:two-component system, NarL family, sensor kinase